MVKQQQQKRTKYYNSFSAASASGSTHTTMTTQLSLPVDQSIQSSTSIVSLSAYGEL